MAHGESHCFVFVEQYNDFRSFKLFDVFSYFKICFLKNVTNGIETFSLTAADLYRRL